MTRRVTLITEIIAPYRIPVFNALARRAGVELRVIFLAETDTSLRKWKVYTEEICFSYEVLPSWRCWGGKNGLLVNRGLSSALRRANPQTIICGGYNYPASWVARNWARRRDVRFVLWSESNAQDQRVERSGVEWLKRKFVKGCDGFVVPGKSAAAYLQRLGACERDIFVAPNAVDNEFFSARAAEVRADDHGYRQSRGLPLRFILCSARLIQEKGVFDLLAAYAKLDEGIRSEVALVFAGDGSEEGRLKAQSELVRPGMVLFPGFVQREELAILYALAEFMILPTHSDPWGLVVNEAMACGLPVIVSSVAGCAADLVEDGWNGYVVSPRDPETLSLKVDTLLRNHQLRQTMSAHSLERIQNYSPGACAAGLAACSISGGEQD